MERIVNIVKKKVPNPLSSSGSKRGRLSVGGGSSSGPSGSGSRSRGRGGRGASSEVPNLNTFPDIPEQFLRENFEHLQENIGIDDDLDNFDFGDGDGDDVNETAQSDIPAASSAPAPRPPRPVIQRASRSPVWDYFYRDPASPTTHVICKSCNKRLAHATGGNKGGTGTLANHMRNIHRIEPFKHRQQAEGQTRIGPNGQIANYNKEKDRLELAKLVAVNALPFSFPSSPGFVKYIQRVYNPCFEGIPRSTCRNDVYNLYGKYCTYLHWLFQSLKVRFALTSDIGQAVNGNSYLTVTCHWIDDEYRMQARIIAFRYDENLCHDAKFIYDSVNDVCVFYGIKYLINTISFDNASNNTKSIETLIKEMNPPVPEIFHVRCVCHVLNLIVKDGLDFFDSDIKLVRQAVARIQGNNRRQRMLDFQAKCLENEPEPLKFIYMPDEVVTRWNSTFMFLKVCYKYRNPITSVSNAACEYAHHMLNSAHWDRIKVLLQFLKRFYTATLDFSGTSYPTVTNILGNIADIAKFLNAHKDKEGYEGAVGAMFEKFQKYFYPIPPLYQIGCLLDPSFKRIGMEHFTRVIYENLNLNPSQMRNYIGPAESIALVNQIMAKYYSYYQNLSIFCLPESAQVSVRNATETGSSSAGGGDDSFLDDDFEDAWATLPTETNGLGSADELNYYLNMPLESRTKDYHSLEWWSRNTKQFPILHVMARDILNIPVSTVASESAFSQGRQQIGDHRYALSGESLNVLVCLRDWIRSERNIQGIENSTEEDEIATILATGVRSDDFRVTPGTEGSSSSMYGGYYIDDLCDSMTNKM